jgi:hypothetical protein
VTTLERVEDPELAGDIDDGERWETFLQFRRETPDGVLDDPRNAPTYFWGRIGFELWRSRWLPYLAGLTDGPTTPREYAELRPKLYGRRRPFVDMIDRFHS